MGELEGILSLIIGLVIRIGLPVTLTIGILYVLKKLDKRWQKTQIALPVIASSYKSCWKVKNCPEEKRKECPAFQNPEVPCWQTFRANTGLLKENCLGCVVFQNTWVTS